MIARLAAWCGSNVELACILLGLALVALDVAIRLFADVAFGVHLGTFTTRWR